jgi:agmatinase
MIDSILGAAYDEAEAVCIGVPYGDGASFGQGAEHGPRAIKAVLDENLELFDRITKTEPAYDFAFGYRELDQVTNKNLEAMVDTVTQILQQESRYTVLLGGTHSISIGAFQALAQHYNPDDITVVQIDAHLDLREDDSEYNDVDPSPYAHSTVMRHAHNLGFSLLPIGIRTMYSGEYTYAQAHTIPFFEWGRFDQPVPRYSEILEHITTKYVYVTLDVDGLDPSIAPATGTPVPDGLSLQYTEGLLHTLAASHSIIGSDVVETAPHTSTNITEYTAAHLVYKLLSLGTKT